MLYAVICTDKPGEGLALRKATREKHLAYLASFGERVKAAGPFLNDAETDPAGSLIVFDAPSRADADAFAAGDPYALAGVFARVEIRPWRWLIGAGQKEGT